MADGARKRSSTSPTQRSRKLLRDSGYTVESVEKWVKIADQRKKKFGAGHGFKRDLFGFADLLAIHPFRRAILLVQVTSADHLAERIAKAKARQELRDWLRSGGLAQFHGWRRVGGAWEAKVVAVALDDLVDVVVVPTRRKPRGQQKQKQRSLFG